MNDKGDRDDWLRRCERSWRRVRDAVYQAVNAIMGPPPPDAVEKIQDLLGRAKRDFKHKEDRRRCQDEANGKQ